MEMQYAASSSFLTSSMLQVNGDKTHAMLLTTAQNRRLNNLDLTVNFGNDLQRSSKVERLGKISRKKICFDLDIVKIALPPSPPPPVFLDTYEELFFNPKKGKKKNSL